MSEFDPDTRPAPVTPEAKAAARLKLERTIFAAFAAMLLSLAALGTAGYRRALNELSSARLEADSAYRDAAEQTLRADRNYERYRDERDARDVLAENLRLTSGELGLTLARLAVAEARQGPFASRHAGRFLDRSAAHGAPPWFAFARWAARDDRKAIHLEPQTAAGNPSIEMAAVSADASSMVLLHQDGRVEWLDLPSLRRCCGEAQLPAGEVSALTLSPEGDQAAAGLRSGGVLLLQRGTDSGSKAQVAAAFENLSASAVTAIAFSPSGKTLALGFAEGGVIVLSTATGEARRRETPGISTLLCLDDSGATVRLESSGDLYFDDLKLGSLGKTRRGALRYSTGRLFAAAWSGEELGVAAAGLLSADFEARVIAPPLGSVTALSFDADGTLQLGDVHGRRMSIPPDGEAEPVTYAGSHAVRLLAGTPFGDLSVTAEGGVSHRPDEQTLRRGFLAASVAAPDGVEVTPFGFVVGTPETGWSIRPSEASGWSNGGIHAAVLPTRSGFAAIREGQVRLPWGESVRAGELLAVFGGGASVLCRTADGHLAIYREHAPPTIVASPSAHMPEEAAISCNAEFALLSSKGAVWLLDAAGAKVAPLEVPAGATALSLDASGGRAAWAQGTMVSVVSPAEGRLEAVIATRFAPKKTGLMFGGALLVTLEDDGLAWYEVETGLELWRSEAGETDFAATDDRLFTVSPDGLRVLDFP